MGILPPTIIQLLWITLSLVLAIAYTLLHAKEKHVVLGHSSSVMLPSYCSNHGTAYQTTVLDLLTRLHQYSGTSQAKCLGQRKTHKMKASCEFLGALQDEDIFILQGTFSHRNALKFN